MLSASVLLFGWDDRILYFNHFTVTDLGEGSHSSETRQVDNGALPFEPHIRSGGFGYDVNE